MIDTPDSPAPPKSALPIWAKLLLFFFLSGMVVVVAILGTFTYWLGNSSNQAYIEKTAKTLVQFSQPLPKGFYYDRALGWGTTSIVILVHDPDKTIITLMGTPNISEQDARQIVEDIQKSEGQAGNPLSSPVEVKSSGTLTVAGQQMYYVTGTPRGISAYKQQDFTGAVVAENKKKTILIKGITPSESYNMEATRQLLNAIKSF